MEGKGGGGGMEGKGGGGGKERGVLTLTYPHTLTHTPSHAFSHFLVSVRKSISQYSVCADGQLLS